MRKKTSGPQKRAMASGTKGKIRTIEDAGTMDKYVAETIAEGNAFYLRRVPKEKQIMKNRTVRVNGAAPSNTPKAVTYADIKGQGRIPYGKTAPAPVAGGLTDFANTPRKMKTRGTGAAIKGTSHMGY